MRAERKENADSSRHRRRVVGAWRGGPGVPVEGTGRLVADRYGAVTPDPSWIRSVGLRRWHPAVSKNHAAFGGVDVNNFVYAPLFGKSSIAFLVLAFDDVAEILGTVMIDGEVPTVCHAKIGIFFNI